MVVVKPVGPHHFTTCCGSVHASQTRSRGASNTRVIKISRSEVSSTGMLLADMFLLLFLQLAQVFSEAIESLLPDFTVFFHPVGNILEARRFQPARPPLRLAPARDQPRSFEHLKM